jgi:SAM-dependent methyltransferase
MRQLKVFWILITQLGTAVRLGKDTGLMVRYRILKTLVDEGLYDYLREPRTYGQILARFNFVDSDFTRELFEIVAQRDKENTIILENNLYRVNPEHPVPTEETVLASVADKFHNFLPLFEGIVGQLPARLRREPIELSATLENPGRALMDRFDEALGNIIYSAMRNAAFAFLPRQERRWLHGKKLLDAGCGSGRETADIWLKMKGDIHITAIDSVAGMIERAGEDFPALLDEMKRGHPPLTDANRPVFRQASVTDLPFEDNTFDAAFHVQMLHWTSSPRKAVEELVRVVRPDGLIFGAQGDKQNIDPYMDLGIRVSENCRGFFWLEEFERWYSDLGMTPEIVKPVGVFRVRIRKPPLA